MVNRMVTIDWKTIKFTVGFFIAALIPPVIVAGVVSFLRGAPQDLIIGTSSLTIIPVSIGIGIATYLADALGVSEKGRLGWAVLLILIIVIAWVIPLMLMGTIPISEILKRLSNIFG